MVVAARLTCLPASGVWLMLAGWLQGGFGLRWLAGLLTLPGGVVLCRQVGDRVISIDGVKVSTEQDAKALALGASIAPRSLRLPPAAQRVRRLGHCTALPPFPSARGSESVSRSSDGMKDTMGARAVAAW